MERNLKINALSAQVSNFVKILIPRLSVEFSCSLGSWCYLVCFPDLLAQKLQAISHEFLLFGLLQYSQFPSCFSVCNSLYSTELQGLLPPLNVSVSSNLWQQSLLLCVMLSAKTRRTFRQQSQGSCSSFSATFLLLFSAWYYCRFQKSSAVHLAELQSAVSFCVLCISASGVFAHE